jgi:hypothetical protein
MKLTLNELKQEIHKIIQEFGGISGGLRSSQRGGKPKHHIGKVEDTNREVSFVEANDLFPGSVEVWVEVVPALWPEAPIHMDPISIKRGTLFFKEGDKLTAAFQDMPQITLATWDSMKQDWIENDFSENQGF